MSDGADGRKAFSDPSRAPVGDGGKGPKTGTQSLTPEPGGNKQCRKQNTRASVF
jgi:hypothetical protein